MSQKKCWMKISAWLVIAVFLPEQICWAGISDDIKSRLPSLKSTAQSTVSSVRTTYNAATKISGAIQQVTGISPTKLDSISNKIGLTKLAAGLAAGVITQKPQVVSQIANINLRDKAVSVVSSLSNSINNKWVALNDSFFKSSLVDHKKQALSLNPQGAEYKSYMSWMETNDPKVFGEVKALEKQGLVGKKFSDTYDGPMTGTAKAIDSLSVNKFTYRYAGDPEIGAPEVLGVAATFAEIPNGIGETASLLTGRSGDYQKWASNLGVTQVYRNWKNNNVEQPLIAKYGNKYYQEMMKPEIEAAGLGISLLIPVGGWAGATSKVSKVSVLGNVINKIPLISRFSKGARVAEIGNLGGRGSGILGRLGQGVNYARQGRNFIWNSRPVVTYGKYILAPAGVAVMANTFYGYSSLKSPAFSAYTSNQGRITNLIEEISLAQHIRAPGTFNSSSYETAISDLSQAFPGETVTSEKVSGYLAQNPEKYKDIKSDDPEITAHLAKIVQLSNQNGELAGQFNTYEKTFMGLAEVNTVAVNGLANGINSLGVPYAGEFLKSVGSFTPLTGLSIGAAVGADPTQGFRGFANFIVSPVEDIVGLRTGSFIYNLAKAQNPFQDFNANYRNIGRGLGSAFILLGGGRQIKDTAGVLKTKANTGYFSGIKAAANSVLSANPRINNFVSKPWVKPLASQAVLMGPLAAAALWQGYNNGDLGVPVASAAVLFAPNLARGGINKFSQQKLESAFGSMSVIKKTVEMDNAFSLLGKMAEEKELAMGKPNNIMRDHALTGGTFEAIGDIHNGEIFTVGPHRYIDLKNNAPREFLLTPQLLTAKPGDSVYLIPNTAVSNLNFDDHKIKKQLSRLFNERLQIIRELGTGKTSGFVNKINSGLKGGPAVLKDASLKKSPIPVKNLFEDQVATLKSMITSGIKERLAVIRGLGTGKTTALLAYVLPYKMADNLRNDKVTLILTPNDVVTKDVKAVLRGANDVGFNHQEIQKRLETNVNFPEKITEKGLRIESVDRFEDKLKQEQDFIDKVMNNDVVVVPYELYSSIYHTYLMRSGPMDAVREKVTNRIKDSNFLMDEVDMPAFLPALMMSEGRKFVPEGNLEYNYWQDVAVKSRQIYDKAKNGKIDVNDMKLDKIEGETDAETDFRAMAQGVKLASERIPGIEELPLPNSATVQSLVKEIKSKHGEIGYTEQEMAEHIARGAWGYRSYELRNSFAKEEYAVRTKTIPAEDIDIYGPKKGVNTVIVGGVEGRDIHNFELHIPSGQHQILEILHGAKLISRPLKGDHMGKSIDALEILGGGIGFTGTASDTVKPVLKEAGFTKFDYGQVKASDYEVPVVNSDLSRTVKDVADSIINNKNDRLDIDITPNNPMSRLIKKVLTAQGVQPARLAKIGDDFKFVSGKYVHIGGRTPEKVAQALLDSLKTKEAPYAIVGTANLIGRGLNFDAAPYLAKDGTKAVVNLIEPELMTATQVLQGAGRIGGKYRFTNIPDAQKKPHNPQKIVRLLMSREMMRPMAEFKDILSSTDAKSGLQSLKIMDALQDVWNRNERDVVSRSGLSAERLASNKIKNEFKEMDIPVTYEGIEKSVAGIGLQQYFLDKKFIMEHAEQNSQAQGTERRLTVNGLRFMQLFNEVKSLSEEQFKSLDRIKAIQLLHIDDPVELAKGLVDNKFVELENYNNKGLSSVLSLARMLKPFEADISSADFDDYQNINSGTVEQKLEFFKGLIDKNKIKIDEPGTRDLILNKLNQQKQAWEKVQEINRQVQTNYARNNAVGASNGILQLRAAYRELENVVTYRDLEDISSKLNSPALVDLIPWFIPNSGPEELAKLSAVFDFTRNNNIKLNSQNLFELLELTDENNKGDFAGFVGQNTKDPALKIYAQRVAVYQGALAKQMQYFSRLWSGKKIDVEDYERGLQDDIEFLKNFNINPTQDFQLDLTQLRNLSGGNLSDELLLKVYQGPMATKEEIDNNVLDEGIRNTVYEHFISWGAPQALNELRQLKKLWGTEAALKKIQEKYPAEIVNSVIKEYLADLEQGGDLKWNNFNAQRKEIVNTASLETPGHSLNKDAALNVAAVMGLSYIKPFNDNAAVQFPEELRGKGGLNASYGFNDARTGLKVSQALSELQQLKKTWGTEEAVKRLSRVYSPEIVNQALMEYTVISENNLGVKPETLAVMPGIENKLNIEPGIKAVLDKMAPVNNPSGNNLINIAGTEATGINNRFETNLGGKKQELGELPVVGAMSQLTGNLAETDILGADLKGLGKWIVSSGVSPIEVEKFFDNNQKLAKAMVLGLFNKAGEVNKFKVLLPGMIEATAGKLEVGADNQWNFKIPGITGELEAIELNLAPEMAKVRFMELAQEAGMPEPQMMQAVAAIGRGLMAQPSLRLLAEKLDINLPELAAEFMIRDRQIGEPGKIDDRSFYFPSNKIIETVAKKFDKKINTEQISSIHKESLKLVQSLGAVELKTVETVPIARGIDGTFSGTGLLPNIVTSGKLQGRGHLNVSYSGLGGTLSKAEFPNINDGLKEADILGADLEELGKWIGTSGVYEAEVSGFFAKTKFAREMVLKLYNESGNVNRFKAWLPDLIRAKEKELKVDEFNQMDWKIPAQSGGLKTVKWDLNEEIAKVEFIRLAEEAGMLGPEAMKAVEAINHGLVKQPGLKLLAEKLNISLPKFVAELMIRDSKINEPDNIKEGGFYYPSNKIIKEIAGKFKKEIGNVDITRIKESALRLSRVEIDTDKPELKAVEKGPEAVKNIINTGLSRMNIPLSRTPVTEMPDIVKVQLPEEHQDRGHLNVSYSGAESLFNINDGLNEMHILGTDLKGLGKWIVSSGVSPIEVEKFFDNNQELAKAMVLGLYNKAGDVNKFKALLPRMIEATAGKLEVGVNNQWNFKIPGITGELEAIELNLAPEMAKVRFMELAQEAGMPELRMMKTMEAVGLGLLKQPAVILLSKELNISIPELAAELMARDNQISEPDNIKEGKFYSPSNKVIKEIAVKFMREIANETIAKIQKTALKLVQKTGDLSQDELKVVETTPVAENKFEIKDPDIKAAMVKEKGKFPEAEKIAPAEMAQVLSEFDHLNKLWGSEKAIKMIIKKYSSEIAREVVNVYMHSIEQKRNKDVNNIIVPQEKINIPAVPPVWRNLGIEKSMITPAISVFSLKAPAIGLKTSTDIVQELSSNEVLPVSPETMEALHSIIPDLEPMTPLKPLPMILTSSLNNNPSNNGGSFLQEKEVPPAETCL